LLVGPDSYPLCWGETEPPSADLVPLPPGLDTSRTRPTSPGCFKVGTGGFWLAYAVEDWVEEGSLTVVIWDEGTGEMLGTIFTRFGVYVVLDEPKPPMEPAWVSVLNISCQWARGESTPEGAAALLTQKLWENGQYNGGYGAYTRYFRDASGEPIDNQERFYLRAFLEDPWFPWGQCNDFADFLVCLIASTGVPIDRVRRTHQLLLTDATNFRTNWITPAGQTPTKAEWTYHQFAFTDHVWDGSLVLGEYGGFVKGMNFDDYKSRLVEVILRCDWQLAPPAGWFVPEVSAVAADQMPPWPWAN